MVLKKAVYLLFCLLFLSIASGQINGIGEQIEEGVGNLENNLTAAREFTERERWDFIGENWKEFLLKVKLFQTINAFFTKIDMIFVILFGMSWELSGKMFFAFSLWVVTFLSTFNYFYNKNWILNLLYSFLIVLGLAFLKFFSLFGETASSFIGYGSSFSLKLIFFLIIIGILACFYVVNRIFARKVKQQIKARKEMKNEINMRNIQGVVKGLKEGMS